MPDPCTESGCEAVVAPSGRASALLSDVVREDGPALRRFILSRIRDVAETEDLLQDLYLRLLHNREAVEQAESRRAYLLSMARNLIRDRHRHAAVRNRALTDLGFQQHGRVEPALQEHLIRARQGRAALGRAMERLRPQHREIFELSRMQGVRNSDIASQLRISLRSVERHVSEVSVYVRETLATCI